MDLYLIRHTRPQVLDGVCYGHADIDVAPSFNEDFEILKNKLNAIKPAGIFSSPLQRCLKLADATATHLNSATVTQDSRLMELNLIVVAGGGIEPPTRGFSIRCSTN